MPYRFMCFPGGKRKAVTLSYDDGSRHDAKLLEIINKYGLKCTFNLNSERLLSGKGLTVDEVKGLLADGHEIAVHGAEHLANGIVRPVHGIRDVLRCRETLEETFGIMVRGMAYPDTGIVRFFEGRDYQTIRTYLEDLGLVYARTLSGDNDSFMMPSDWFAWMPTAHHTNPKLRDYMDKFINLDVNAEYHSRRYARLFYIWGHAHEFHNNNNWELLEEICEKLGGREDIWYATNMEIYDYAKAYEALVWNTAGTRVYNPTLIDVWFGIGNDFYCLKSGETMTFDK